MDKPNVKEILASLSGVWNQKKDENLNTPNEILNNLPDDFIKAKFCTNDIFKTPLKKPNQDVAAINKQHIQSKKIALMKFLQYAEKYEALSQELRFEMPSHTEIYLRYVRNFSISYNDTQYFIQNILTSAFSLSFCIGDSYNYNRVFQGTILDKEYSSPSNVEKITQHIFFKVLLDVLNRQGLDYNNLYTYLGYWKSKGKNQATFCPYITLHSSHTHAKALDDYLSQIPQNKKEKGRFYYDIASEPSLEYNYPNISYFQIHKIISLCYNAILRLQKWQIKPLVEYLLKPFDSSRIYIELEPNSFENILTHLQALTPEITDCKELLFHHLSCMANVCNSTNLIDYIEQTYNEVKSFATSHSKAQVKALFEISYNASMFSLYKRDYLYKETYTENYTHHNFHFYSDRTKDKINQFLKTLHLAMQYYQQLFKAKGHRAMLFADSITKSLAVRVLLESYNDESIPQKKHFDNAKRVIFTYLYISSDVDIEWGLKENEFVLYKNDVFLFFSNFAEYQRYGRGLYEWRGFDYTIKEYHSYLCLDHKAKHKKQLQKSRQKLAKIQAEGARFELFSYIVREQIERIEQTQLQHKTFDLTNTNCLALLDIEQSKLLLQAMLDVLCSKQTKPNIELVTNFEAISISSDELKNVAYIHLESFLGFIYDKCMIRVIGLEQSDFIEYCLGAILQSGQWESAFENLQ